jgi:hypothetical protein
MIVTVPQRTEDQCVFSMGLLIKGKSAVFSVEARYEYASYMYLVQPEFIQKEIIVCPLQDCDFATQFLSPKIFFL